MITIENTVEYNEEERAYYIDGNDNISFMEIHEYEDEDERGYDYTYFRSDYTEYDGGQLDNPEYTMNQAVEELLGDEDIDCNQITPIDHDILLEATNEANNIIYHSRATKKEIDRMLLESSKKYDDMLFGNQGKEDTKIFEIFHIIDSLGDHLEQYKSKNHTMCFRPYDEKEGNMIRSIIAEPNELIVEQREYNYEKNNVLIKRMQFTKTYMEIEKATRYV